MKDTTKKIVIRHLKGIISALEKDDEICSHDKKMNEKCMPCGRMTHK